MKLAGTGQKKPGEKGALPGRMIYKEREYFLITPWGAVADTIPHKYVGLVTAHTKR